MFCQTLAESCLPQLQNLTGLNMKEACMGGIHEFTLFDKYVTHHILVKSCFICSCLCR